MTAHPHILIRCGAAIAIATLLTGCLGGDADAPPSPTASNTTAADGGTKPRIPDGRSGTENSTPTLTGKPTLVVTADQEYSFQPRASDADDDKLTFLIQNKPEWATFDDATGRLSGRPTAADVGSYADVTISVTDGMTSDALAPFNITVTAVANGQVTLSWTAPTQNADGSPLTNLAGYKIYYGTSTTSLGKVLKIGVGLTSAVIENLSSGTWYFAMSSYNSAGVESERTAVVSKRIASS